MTAQLKKKGFTDKQIEAFLYLKARDEYGDKIHDGDRVQFNRETMMTDPNWERKQPEYIAWCEQHFGETFTARTYKEKRPDLWQLEEDTTEPKWLFHASELTVIKTEGEIE